MPDKHHVFSSLRKQHFAFHLGGCRCNGKREWLANNFTERDGTALWSDSSSLPGRVAGEDYEQCVRLRLTGSDRKQDAARVEAELEKDQIKSLRELEQEAAEASKKNVGSQLQEPLFGTTKAGSNYRVAEADAVLEEEKDLVQSLGEGAELLHGSGSAPAGTVVEATNHDAFFYRKCFQLEKYLTMRAAVDCLPPAAVLVINKKPVRCSEEWLQAIDKFPVLKDLPFSILYFPHSLNIAQHQQRIERLIAEKDEMIAERDEMIEQIAFIVFFLVLLVAYLRSVVYRKCNPRGALMAFHSPYRGAKTESWTRSNTYPMNTR